MKTKEELQELSQQLKNFNKKLSELSEDELKQVVGAGITIKPNDGKFWYSYNPSAIYSDFDSPKIDKMVV